MTSETLTNVSAQRACSATPGEPQAQIQVVNDDGPTIHFSRPKSRIFSSDLLRGEKVFYRQHDYLQMTKAEFAQINPLPISYSWSSTNWKTIRIIKKILSMQIVSIIFFPWGIYKILHVIAGKMILPSSQKDFFSRHYEGSLDDLRSSLPLNTEWKFKRITVEVDGYMIDAAIIGKESTFENGRWLLASVGNGEYYEHKLHGTQGQFGQILEGIGSNALVFNYPGVGASSGEPNRQAMAKAYRAMLTFLEDPQRIGAKEIIGYGHSVGGGVQGDALRTHNLKDGIRYVFVKSRTFSNLSSEVSSLLCRLLGLLIKILGWNMDSVESSRNLPAPASEIILQTVNNVGGYIELREGDEAKIINDGVILANASHARALLSNHSCPKQNKVFIGMPEGHMDPLIDPSFLSWEINELLARQPLEPRYLHRD